MEITYKKKTNQIHIQTSPKENSKLNTKYVQSHISYKKKPLKYKQEPWSVLWLDSRQFVLCETRRKKKRKGINN